MKKKWILGIAIGVVLAGGAAVTVIHSHSSGSRPFQNLRASDIVSASVHLTPPDETAPVDDTEELAGLLRDIVIYNKSVGYQTYAGQSVTFTIALSDGSHMEVTEANPFIVIDGTGYKAEYEICEALNRYANRLLESTTENR